MTRFPVAFAAAFGAFALAACSDSPTSPTPSSPSLQRSAPAIPGACDLTGATLTLNLATTVGIVTHLFTLNSSTPAGAFAGLGRNVTFGGAPNSESITGSLVFDAISFEVLFPPPPAPTVASFSGSGTVSPTGAIAGTWDGSTFTGSLALASGATCDCSVATVIAVNYLSHLGLAPNEGLGQSIVRQVTAQMGPQGEFQGFQRCTFGYQLAVVNFVQSQLP